MKPLEIRRKFLKKALPIVGVILEIREKQKKPGTITGSIYLFLGKPKLTKPISFMKKF